MARTTVKSEQLRDANIQIVDFIDFAVVVGTGLYVMVQPGRLRNDNTIVNVNVGSYLMTDNTTNYVEVDNVGTVSVNVTGFTTGRIPLAIVVTSGGNVSSITDKRTWLPTSTGTELTRKPYHGIETFGALSFNNSTKALTIASGANTYWYKGTKYTTTAAIVCDLDLTADRDNSVNTLTANTLYYFYFKDATGKLYWSDSSWNFFNHVFVATVFWNGSSGSCQKEIHSHTRNIDWHIWAHDTIGTRYESGLTLTNPTTANDALLKIETGNIHDEDIDFATGQMTTMRGWYKASASMYTFQDYALPYIGTSGNPQYLRTTDYTLQAVPNASYAVYWVYVSLDIARPLYIVPTHATAASNSIANARLETAPSLLGLNINAEMKLIYKFIYKGDGQFQESVDYRNSSPVPGGGTSTVTAGAVSVIPSGNIASTNAQAALEELDAEKAAIAQTMYIGTTQIPINRASAELTIAGITLTNPVISGHIIGGDGTSSPYNNITNGSFETWAGLTDILIDGAFEVWASSSVLTNWTIVRGTLAQESTIKKAGTYSAKLTGPAGNTGCLQQQIVSTAYRNKVMVGGIWIYSLSAGARIQLYDGVDSAFSANHGGTGWEYLTAVLSCGASGTEVRMLIYTPDSVVSYFDSAIIYEQLAPAGWTLAGAGATVAREESTIKVGTYSVKLTRGGADATLTQDIQNAGGHNLAYWKGRTVTFGCWVNATVANRAVIYIYDGTAASVSSYHSGGGTYEYLTVTRTLSLSATTIQMTCAIGNGDTTAYFDGATVNEGSTPFTFSEPPVLIASDKSVTVPTSLTATLGDITVTNGNFKIGTADKGIDFSANSSAAGMTSELLDDYEEGTWTMGVSFGGGTTGITYTYNVGTYTKIGNLVTIIGYVQLSSKGSSTGTALLTGLPFSNGGAIENYVAMSCWFFNIAFANQYSMYIAASVANAKIYEITEAGVLSVLTDADFSNNSGIIINCSYRVN